MHVTDWMWVCIGRGGVLDQELNLANIVENEVTAKTPVLLASDVGYDASS